MIAAASISALPAIAQTYPSKPIRFNSIALLLAAHPALAAKVIEDAGIKAE